MPKYVVFSFILYLFKFISNCVFLYVYSELNIFKDAAYEV